MHTSKRYFQLAIFIAALTLVTSAEAWNDFGHMAVAYLAYQNLTPTARDRANTLIKLNPRYASWTGWVPAGTADADRDQLIFMFAATWPDEIKADHAYTADGSNGGNRPDGSPDPTANKGYSDFLMHKYWHFIDVPFSSDGTPLPAIPTPNAKERIALFRTTLSSDADDALKSYDLVWLLHLVGDVHQPLHCISRISATDPNGDAGGNFVKLTGTPSSLHAFWDDILGSGSAQTIPPTVIKVAKKLPKPDASLAAKANADDWIAESVAASEHQVYSAPIGATDGPFTVTSKYQKAALKLAKQRVALAGARLANLINAELK